MSQSRFFRWKILNVEFKIEINEYTNDDFFVFP